MQTKTPSTRFLYPSNYTLSVTATQVEKKQAVMEKKVNEAQNTNQQMREKINGLRKEHLVYDKLFEKLEVCILLVGAKR